MLSGEDARHYIAVHGYTLVMHAFCISSNIFSHCCEEHTAGLSNAVQLCFSLLTKGYVV